MSRSESPSRRAGSKDKGFSSVLLVNAGTADAGVGICCAASWVAAPTATVASAVACKKVRRSVMCVVMVVPPLNYLQYETAYGGNNYHFHHGAFETKKRNYGRQRQHRRRPVERPAKS